MLMPEVAAVYRLIYGSRFIYLVSIPRLFRVYSYALAPLRSGKDTIAPQSRRLHLCGYERLFLGSLFGGFSARELW
jgi:hypothetical protein